MATNLNAPKLKRGVSETTSAKPDRDQGRARSRVRQINNESAPRPNNALPDETEAQRIDRLGRSRPPQFSSWKSEFAFCYSILASQFMAEFFVSGFNVLVPSLLTALNISPNAAVWPSASFALVTSAFLLPFGRLADMYGGFPVFMFGLIWFTIWSLVCGFSQNELTLNWCRALQGLGPAAFLPSGTGLIGKTYRPGPRKNLIFGLYGAAAVLGFFAGVLMAGAAASYLNFRWYFYIGAILVATTVVAAGYAVPNDLHVRRQTEMDWLGGGLMVSGLILTVFGLTDGSHAPNKWATPYIPVTIGVGILCLIAAYYVERNVAKSPLIDVALFRVPHMKALFVGCFLSYGCLGVFLLYSTLYMSNIRHASPILISIWYIPMCVGGIILSVAGGYILHLIPGTFLVLISTSGWILSAVLFANAPPDGNYWAWIFPAMIGATVGIDVTFNVANIFITTSVSVRQQGVAGAVMNSLLYLGIAFLLAFADVTQTETIDKVGELESYRYVFWFMFAVAGLAMVILALFVRIPKASSELTVDEREALLPEDEDASAQAGAASESASGIELHRMPSYRRADQSQNQSQNQSNRESMVST